MAFGLSETGFSKKRLEDIKTEVQSELRSVYGDQVNLLETSVLGQFVGIFSERESKIWELAEDVYNSQYPDSSEGIPLDNVASITGVTRLGATTSTVPGQLFFGTVATVIPIGTIISVSGNSTARFLTKSAITLVAGTDEIQTLSFSATPTSGSFSLIFDGQTTATIPFSGTASTVETALEALSNIDDVTVTGSFAAGFVVTFIGSLVAKEDVPSLIEDTNTLDMGGPVTLTITETTKGVPQGIVDMEAESTGPVQAPIGTLTVIETPVFGLSSTRNRLAEDPIGTDIETDLELKLRRQEIIQLAGAGTVEAIRSRLLNLTGVTAVTVFENATQVTDGDGRPPHSFESVVQGGVEQTIIQEIWESKPAGIATFGSTTGNAVDTQGFSPVINFSRPTEVDIFFEIDVTTDSTFTATAQQITDAYVAFGNALGIGTDVVVRPSVLCVMDDFTGVTDVVIRIGFSASPTLDDNLTIDLDEVSNWLDANITVTLI